MNKPLCFYKNLSGDTLIDGTYKPEDKNIIVYSLTTAYLIKRGEYITAGEYADRIVEVYDIDDPRTHHIIDTLRRYSKGN